MTKDFNYHFEERIEKTRSSESYCFLLNLDQCIHVAHTTQTSMAISYTCFRSGPNRSTDSIINNPIVHPPACEIILLLPWYCHSTNLLTQWKIITYRKLSNIDLTTFIKNISSSQLCTNPPDDLDVLVNMYNNTLQEILANHAPTQTKQVQVWQQAKWYIKDIALAKKSRRKEKRRKAGKSGAP